MRKTVLFLAAVLLAAALTGCSFTRESARPNAIPDRVREIHSEKELEQGQYYIMHEGEDGTVYYIPYAGEESDGTGAENTMWFYHDWAAVPTMYEGDRLIFRMDETFDEQFDFTRYEYVGPTIGISRIKRRESGRYYADTSAENMGNGVISARSDAYKLYELNSEVTVINRLGGARLKSGNISRGGLLLGLEEGKSYNAELYVGTKQYDYPLRADAIALTAMEQFRTNDYTFLDGKVAEVNIPKYFNTGYYRVSGGGLFRFVRGTGYSEATDFNVANNAEDEAFEYELPDEEEAEASANAPQTETVLIDNDGPATIEIRWEDAAESVKRTYGDIPDPNAKLITDSGAYTFTKDGENTLRLSTALAAGRYELEIGDLYGRDYTVLTSEDGLGLPESAAEQPAG